MWNSSIFGEQALFCSTLLLPMRVHGVCLLTERLNQFSGMNQGHMPTVSLPLTLSGFKRIWHMSHAIEQHRNPASVFYIGYNGTKCELKVDFCHPNPCVAGHFRQCISGPDGFYCECLPGWSGKTCQVTMEATGLTFLSPMISSP